MACFKVLPHCLSGRAEEKCEKSQDGWPSDRDLNQESPHM